MHFLLLLPLALILSISANAATITDLSWSDESHLATQRARVDELSRRHLGTPIRGELSDLNTLQRLIDRELVEKDDAQMQQAMGVVLGNVFILEEPTLSWQIYEDDLGRTRALCIPAEECLFPVTMLSRRMAAGLKPNVKKIFTEALDLLEPHLPELPYGAERRRSPL